MNQADKEAFEKKFPMPSNCIRCGDGYAATSYNAWGAQAYSQKWEGFKAGIAHARSGEAVAYAFQSDLVDFEKGVKSNALCYSHQAQSVHAKENAVPLFTHSQPATYPSVAQGGVSVEEFEAMKHDLEGYISANTELIRDNQLLLSALKASNHQIHKYPGFGGCLCSQCEFVRLRDAAIKKAECSTDLAQAKKAEVRIEKFGVVSEKNGMFSLDGFTLDCRDFENIDKKDFVVSFLESIKQRIESEIENAKTDADFRFNNSRFNGKLIE